MMITDEHIVAYMHSLANENSDILRDIERYAHETDVPIIRKEMESFLKVMIAVRKPLRILELGTAIGYSAILMSESMPENCHITTIENYEKRIEIARGNIINAGADDKITLVCGDAYEVMDSLDGAFDFIFMDAAKAQYVNYLPKVLKLMSEGAILITDNVLQEGDLVMSRYAVDRRDRTIHARMREFIRLLLDTKELETTIVPIGDGITLSVKR